MMQDQRLSGRSSSGTAARRAMAAALAAVCSAVTGACSPPSTPQVPALRAVPSAATAAPVRPAMRSPDDDVIRFLEDRLRTDPDDITAQNRLSDMYLRRFRRTGDDGDLLLARRAADLSLAAVPAEGNPGGLAARARAAFALHGFAQARDDALSLAELEAAKPYPLEILGDALLELGDVAEAAGIYARMAEFGDSSVATEARLARLAVLRGEPEVAARRLDTAVALAEDRRASAPETLVWCRVQAGQLAFSRGDWEAAERHYDAALAVAPDDWAALDHFAELRAAQRQFDVAVALYERIVARVPRPEIRQALGDALTAAGRRDEARQHYAAAVAAYRAAAEGGSPHYYHHLVDYLCEVEPTPDEAVRWARKDLEVRRSVYAWEGLAKALALSGDAAGAAQAMDAALALGTKDAHLLRGAGLVYQRAGDPVRARDCLARAASANPKFLEFHVHR